MPEALPEMPAAHREAVVGEEDFGGAEAGRRRLREAVGAEVDAASEVVRLGGAHGVVHGIAVEEEAAAGHGGAGEVVGVGVNLRGVVVLAPGNFFPPGDGRGGRSAEEFREEDVARGAFVTPVGT